ncbi:MAG TPA: Ig-like domain-containing protein, partial [Actinomycetota bacterium]|nr:Ig-like domain-containing protein [Actinomycetota bacterium]
TRTGALQSCTDIKAGCAPTTTEPAATTLSLTVEGNGANRRLTATLTETGSAAPVAGEEIAFFADGAPLGTAVTGADGVATFTPARQEAAGHRTYRAEFAGDEAYEPSAAEASG